MRDLVQMRKQVIDENDLPDEFRRRFETRGDMLQFIQWRNELRCSEDRFFRDHFDNFYIAFQNEAFWKTHYINFI